MDPRFRKPLSTCQLVIFQLDTKVAYNYYNVYCEMNVLFMLNDRSCINVNCVNG
jgi:hypothetical protein